MPLDPAKPRRRSIRLPAYDYAAPGRYFVTICTHGCAPRFGAVVDGAMRLNALGRIADEEWRRTAEVRRGVRLVAHVVMPNHVHLLFDLVGDDARTMPAAPAASTPTATSTVGATRRVAPTTAARGPVPGSVGAIVGQFKSVVARRINALRGTPGAAVWQRNYHERVVRDAREADLIRRYVEENPLRWALDRYHV